ncbi:MAG: alpha/beta fold hydrolase [Gammaproteobacteria bacterium]
MNTLWLQRPQRAVGERPTVIGLHAAAGSAKQWQSLAERLRLSYRVLAPNLHAHATRHGPGEPLSLDAEAALIEPRLDAFHGPVYLVGHDYGAAVAMKLAQRRRDCIAGLVLYDRHPSVSCSPIRGPVMPPWTSRSSGVCSGVISRPAIGSGRHGAMWTTDRARMHGRASQPRSGRRSPDACPSCARRSMPSSPIRRSLRSTPRSRYRYCS